MASSFKDTGICAVPRRIDPETSRFLTSVKSQIERLSGIAGDDADRAVRISELANGEISIGPGPVDAGKSTRVLKAPRNLQAYNLMIAHRLTWENVEKSYSHVEVWCAFDSTALDDAELIGIATKPVAEFTHNGTSTRRTHTYFIRAVGWDGAISPWVPPQGGIVVPPANDRTINDLLSEIFDDNRYTSQHVIVADSFKVVRPGVGTSGAKSVFATGNVGGVDTIGISANMVIDGTILTRMLDAQCVTADKIGAGQINAGHIQANAIDGTHIKATSSIRLNEGGKLTAGMNNIIIDSSDNSIIVAPDNGTAVGSPNLTGLDYARLSNGDIEFFIWNGSGSHVKYNSMMRIEHGKTPSGTTVRIPGYFKEPPHIVLSPAMLPLYNADYSLSSQTLSLDLAPFYDGRLVREWSTRQWEFTPKLELQIAGGADYLMLGDTTYSDFADVTGIFSSIPRGVWYNWKAYTIPPSVQSVYIDFDFYSVNVPNFDDPYHHHYAKRIRLGSYVYQESTEDGQPNGRNQVRVPCAVSESPQTMYIDVKHDDHYGNTSGSKARLRVYSMYRQQANASAIGSGVINWTAYGR